MTEVVCVAAGVVTGGFMGVVLMCILQINRINKYERRIAKLKKQLEEVRNGNQRKNSKASRDNQVSFKEIL